MELEQSQECECEPYFRFRVKMSTQLWRLRVRLANAVNLLDADRIQIQVRDRMIADDAARLHFVGTCNLSASPRNVLPDGSLCRRVA